MIPKESGILDAFHHFWQIYARRDNGAATIEDLRPLFSANVTTIGTGEHEFGSSFEEVIQHFSNDLHEFSEPIHIEFSDEQVKLLSPTTGLVEAQMLFIMKDDLQQELTFPTRISTIFVFDDDQWLLAHNHVSMPSQDQEDGEAFPLDALKAQNKRLEQQVQERTKRLKERTEQLRMEKHKTEQLLYTILPKEVAQELRENGIAEAKDFQIVSVLFTDFEEFTLKSGKMKAQELVDEINIVFVNSIRFVSTTRLKRSRPLEMPTWRRVVCRQNIRNL